MPLNQVNFEQSCFMLHNTKHQKPNTILRILDRNIFPRNLSGNYLSNKGITICFTPNFTQLQAYNYLRDCTAKDHLRDELHLPCPKVALCVFCEWMPKTSGTVHGFWVRAEHCSGPEHAWLTGCWRESGKQQRSSPVVVRCSKAGQLASWQAAWRLL